MRLSFFQHSNIYVRKITYVYCCFQFLFFHMPECNWACSLGCFIRHLSDNFAEMYTLGNAHALTHAYTNSDNGHNMFSERVLYKNTSSMEKRVVNETRMSQLTAQSFNNTICFMKIYFNLHEMFLKRMESIPCLVIMSTELNMHCDVLVLNYFMLRKWKDANILDSWRKSKWAQIA